MSPRLFRYICLFALIFVAFTSGDSTFIEDETSEGSDEFHLVVEHTKEISDFLMKIVDSIDHVSQISEHKNSIFHFVDKITEKIGHPVCGACKSLMKFGRRVTDSKAVERPFAFLVYEACKLKEKAELCKQAIHTFGDLVLEVFTAKLFNPERACAHLHLCPKTWEKELLSDYIQEVLKDKPSTPSPTPTKRSTYKMMHISDLHVDLAYAAGSNSKCDYFQCCRAEFGPAPNASVAAGYWGTVNAACDIPLRTVEQFLKFVSTNLEIDMVLWTGDNVAHDIFQQSPKTQLEQTLDITQLVQEYLPTDSVYAIQGNHEAYPVNEMDYYDNSSYWLTEQLSEIWKGWLDEDSLDHLRQFGFYAQYDPKFNVRVIAVDTNACNNLNFFLFDNPTDPYHQLEYVRSQLYLAEQNNEGVFIIGHIPPGNVNCDSDWSARYNTLIDRFSHVIRGQFFGHTHEDHFAVARSFIDNSPVGAVFVTPSLTTRTSHYPSFRVFEVDTDTNTILNYNQYHINLDLWNSNTTGPLQWTLFYDFLTEWNVTDMTPETIDSIIDQLIENPKLMAQYNYNKHTGTGKPGAPVTEETAWHYYCQAKEGVYSEVVDCLGEHATKADYKKLADQYAPGAWTQPKTKK